MGEHLAENAYGFLPIPIIITEPAVGYGLQAGMDFAISDEDTAVYFQVGPGI